MRITSKKSFQENKGFTMSDMSDNGLVTPNFSTNDKTAKQPITKAVPVNTKDVINCLAVLLLVLKLGVASEKITL